MGNAKMLINARYPDAPPCPTLEYKKAIIINAKLNRIIFSELNRFIFVFGLFVFVSGFRFPQFCHFDEGDLKSAICFYLYSAFHHQPQKSIFFTLYSIF